MILRPYQTRAIEAARRSYSHGHRAICIVAPTGCHAPGQQILMHDGSTKCVESVNIGDAVMGPDSSPRFVEALHSGTDEMFRIAPVKGDPWVVNAGHVLTVVRTNDGWGKANHVTDVPLSDWVNWSRTAKHIHKLFRVSVDFPKQQLGLLRTEDLPLDPYILGVLLGDGSFYGVPGVTTADLEIERDVIAYADSLGMAHSFCPAGGKSKTIVLSSHRQKQASGMFAGFTNPIKSRLFDIGLAGCKCDNKFIPDLYKLGSRETRLAVLAGLLDTDGSLSGSGYDYISKSDRLSSDLAFVCRSLGFAAYVNPCVKTCANNGVSGLYYRVSISGDCSLIPCRIPRKKAEPRRQKKDPLRTGFTVEPVGRGEFFGFTLTGDGRYLLDDFTVTHNSGKTIIGSTIARSATARAQSVLWLAHRQELVDQARAKLPPDVRVTTVQALLASGERPPATVVVLDECHHYVSAQWATIAAHYTSALRIGLTATPERSDGSPLGDLFTDLVVAAQYSELLKGGWIVPCHVYAPDGRGKTLAASVPDAVAEYSRGRQTIVFSATVAEARDAARDIADAQCIDGSTHDAIRAQVVEDFRSGKVRVITNVYVFTEGFDAPAAAVCVLARGAGHASTYLQMCGRVLRTAAEKSHATIVDLVGSSNAHGFPTDDREYSLDGQGIRAKRKPVIWQCKYCGRCLAAPPADRRCPDCGNRIPEPEAIRVARRRLNRKEAAAHATAETKRRAWEVWQRIASERGYKPGWAAYRYKAVYGHWPT